MKIKGKYLIFIFLIISFNIGFLFFFSFHGLQTQFVNRSKEILRHVDQNLESIIKKEKYKDVLSLCNALKENAPKNNVTFTVSDSTANIIFKVGENAPDPARIRSERIIKIGNEFFLISSEDSIGFREFVVHFLINQVFVAEALVIFITVIITGTLLLREYVNPIVLLSKQMIDYEKTSKIPPTPKKRCDELGVLQQQFISFIQTIQLEKQKQNHLIASISHDIKTPLTSIMGYVERLAIKDLPEEKRLHYMQVIYSKAQHMNEIVNEFDEYVSYNLNSSLSFSTYNTSRVCEIVLQEFSAELSDIGVQFKIQNEYKDGFLSLDILKFKRVIGNLISNSLKHMKENPAIHILFRSEKRGVQIVFNDNGTGVAQSDLPYVFDPLFTTDESRKVAGLGLSICQNIIKSHGGTISANNKTNGGLEISIWLPSTH